MWNGWSWEPTVLAGLALAAWGYGRGITALWRRAGLGRGVPCWKAFLFAAGLAALFVALISPLSELAEALLSAHMVQHLALVLVAAPMVVLGAPLLPFLWALPKPMRRALGLWWKEAAMLRAIWHSLSRPVVVWPLHAAALWTWHLPALYQAALQSGLLHALEHGCFFGTAILFWRALAPGKRGRVGYGAGVLYVFAAGVESGLLGALLTFAPTPWYPDYAAGAAAWGCSPLGDQQLAGLIMWIPAGLVYFHVALFLFLAWLNAEKRMVRQEAEIGSFVRRGERFEGGGSMG